jgi:hypothetical protein
LFIVAITQMPAYFGVSFLPTQMAPSANALDKWERADRCNRQQELWRSQTSSNWCCDSQVQPTGRASFGPSGSAPTFPKATDRPTGLLPCAVENFATRDT